MLLTEFDPIQSPASDLLWYCDMTVGPVGEDVPVEDRLAEIATRYGPDHLVTRSIARARDDILAAAKRAEALLERPQPR